MQSSLLVHEQKMNRNSTSEEQALKASTFISSNFQEEGLEVEEKEEEEQIMEIETEATKKAVEILEVMTTVKAEDGILINPR